uniref:Uncharacterized protein n=1 Tax=Amphimedon queenslandica TaxID=400682 RepID=A0A1X7SE75_AMPQE
LVVYSVCTCIMMKPTLSPVKGLITLSCSKLKTPFLSYYRLILSTITMN